jgi:tetratricopeptide (TPR) repeat protein
LAARAARLADEYEEAEEHMALCERLMALAADKNAVRQERALLQLQQGDYRGSMELLAADESDPERAMDELDALAHGYARTFYTPESLSCLRRLAQRDPLHVRGNRLAGTIYATMKYYDRALPFYRRAVERLPDALDPRLDLAKCLLELGEIREADAHLQTLRQRYPDDPDVLFTAARIHLYGAQADEARRLLRTLVESHPDRVDALVELGRLEFQHGDPKIGLAWLEKAVLHNPDKIEAWEAQAHCHEALGQAEPAKRCQREVVRINRDLGEVTRLALIATQEKQDDLNLRFEVANGFERLHEPVKAVQWRYCTLHLDPGHRPTHRALAAYFERSGQPNRAARHRALAGG